MSVRWREQVCSDLQPVGYFDDGWGYYYRHGNVDYLNCCLDRPSMQQLISQLLSECNIHHVASEPGLRISEHRGICYAFNFGPAEVTLPAGYNFVIGSRHLGIGDVAAWKPEHPA